MGILPINVQLQIIDLHHRVNNFIQCLRFNQKCSLTHRPARIYYTTEGRSVTIREQGEGHTGNPKQEMFKSDRSLSTPTGVGEKPPLSRSMNRTSFPLPPHHLPK